MTPTVIRVRAGRDRHHTDRQMQGPTAEVANAAPHNYPSPHQVITVTLLIQELATQTSWHQQRFIRWWSGMRKHSSEYLIAG